LIEKLACTVRSLTELFFQAFNAAGPNTYKAEGRQVRSQVTTLCTKNIEVRAPK